MRFDVNSCVLSHQATVDGLWPTNGKLFDLTSSRRSKFHHHGFLACLFVEVLLCVVHRLCDRWFVAHDGDRVDKAAQVAVEGCTSSLPHVHDVRTQLFKKTLFFSLLGNLACGPIDLWVAGIGTHLPFQGFCLKPLYFNRSAVFPKRSGDKTNVGGRGILKNYPSPQT